MEVDRDPALSMKQSSTAKTKESKRNNESRPESLTINDYEEVKISKESRAMSYGQYRDNDSINAKYNSRAVPPAKGDEVNRTEYEVNESLQMTTFQPNPESTPAGLDFDEFGGGGSSKTQENQDIDKLYDKHFQFLDSLKARQQKLRNILSLYSPYKNVNMTLNALEQMNDVGITNDV